MHKISARCWSAVSSFGTVRDPSTLVTKIRFTSASSGWQKDTGPHNAAIFVDQNRYHASSDSALQGADEILTEWVLNNDYYADHIRELQDEWGDDWYEILFETSNGMSWTLSPMEAAEAIEGTDAAKFIDVYDPEYDEDLY